jgi:hypothetical protein
METSQEYNDTYNGLNDSEKYKSYINSIENSSWFAFVRTVNKTNYVCNP